MDEIKTSEPTGEIFRPETLNPNGQYFLQVRQDNGHSSNYQPVKFVAFTTCPAVVMVIDEAGHFLRVSRIDIFSIQCLLHPMVGIASNYV